MPNKTQQHCKQCNSDGVGSFCNNCGQAYLTKRITTGSVIHEIFHFFSHLDKGILYTLKMLVIAPGAMQKEYVEGHRAKHQKPFSMFFLCATIATLIYYWVNLILLKHFNAGNADEASFFHQYFVILQVLMLPIYTLFTYVFFIGNKYNFAETFVLLLYSLSILIIVSALLQLLLFIWPDLETRFIELPIVVLYNLFTNFKFYGNEKKWVIVIKTILLSAICFLVAGLVQDNLITLL
ncbi:MAG: DUF3667 domain-containing protein [Pedobacter sp.]|nr:MAG: DUF3667 domain-containing protein [Pedobacter sp.]